MLEPRLPDLTRSFERHLEAETRSDRTVETYPEAVRLLEAILAGRGLGLAEADRATCWVRRARPPCPRGTPCDRHGNWTVTGLASLREVGMSRGFRVFRRELAEGWLIGGR